MTNALTLTAEPGQPFVDTLREFDAPVEALFRAHRDNELVIQTFEFEGFPDGYAKLDGVLAS